MYVVQVIAPVDACLAVMEVVAPLVASHECLGEECLRALLLVSE